MYYKSEEFLVRADAGHKIVVGYPVFYSGFTRLDQAWVCLKENADHYRDIYDMDFVQVDPRSIEKIGHIEARKSLCPVSKNDPYEFIYECPVCGIRSFNHLCNFCSNCGNKVEKE